MSYISGLMMGAAIGKSIRQMFAGSRPAVNKAAVAAVPLPPLALVFETAGRRRYRARFSAELGKLLEEKLAKLPFIQKVEANAASGSILILFDETAAARMDALAGWLETTIFTAGPAPAAAGKAADSLPNEDHAGLITRSIRRSARDFSAWIKRTTCGWFDLSAIVSLLFMLRGVRKMVLTQQYPSGTQFIWWALSLMRGWRTV